VPAVVFLLRVFGNVIALLGMQHVVEAQRHLHRRLAAIESDLLDVTPTEAKGIGLFDAMRLAILEGGTSHGFHGIPRLEGDRTNSSYCN
jgi:hypothetical protein